MGRAAPAPLQAPPGTRVQYCCAGFLLLGQLLECIYGQSLAELAVSEVFWPLLVWSDAGTEAWVERDTRLWRLLAAAALGAVHRMRQVRCVWSGSS